MLKNKPSAILFDLDGTIADTALDLSATLNYLLVMAGRDEIDHSLVRNMVGQGAKALIMKGFSHTGDAPDEHELDALFDQYLEYYLNHIADETTLFPGTEVMLKTLKEQDIPLAICTNKNIELTHALLDEMSIAQYFSAVTCGDSFPFKKPDPRHLTATCELLNVNPKHAIMVGDSVNDIAAGLAANMLTVGVTFGYTEKPVREFGPHIVINHFDEFFVALNNA